VDVRNQTGWATGLRSSDIVAKRRSIPARQNVFNKKFPYIAAAINDVLDDTVIDGEVVAIGADGRAGASCTNPVLGVDRG
jgi:hypothetical protein